MSLMVPQKLSYGECRSMTYKQVGFTHVKKSLSWSLDVLGAMLDTYGHAYISLSISATTKTYVDGCL